MAFEETLQIFEFGIIKLKENAPQNCCIVQFLRDIYIQVIL